ncbi:MAG: DNA primase [Pyramidobacter sp.]
MSDEIVAKIKDAIDIVELIGDSVRLERKGRNYSGLCPFHDEKTPSFMVSPERGTWHCFGCGKGGDAFSFVMEKEGLSFPEALEYLARRAGIELPRRRGRSQSVDLYSVMEQAVGFFRTELKSAAGAVGKGYLARRNLTMADADRFELGWAPASWRALNDALRRQGVTQDQLLKCGLVIQGEKGCYDRFRGRVIFPIRNVSGRPVAFGGRIVDGEGAKYLNSPEGPLYNKKNNLYLLDRAKNAIRERGRSILVEGYMDAIRLHMHGRGETVASLGTALTEEQASLLKRFADKCYICYDSDTAGQNATLRGMYVLQRAGLQVYVVRFPGGKDPDEMLQSQGGDALFDKALEKAQPLVLHHISLYRAAAETEGGAKAAEDLLTSLAQLSAVELAPYMQELGHALGLPDYQLASELHRLRRGRRLHVREVGENATSSGFSDAETLLTDVSDVDASRPADPAEAALASLLWSSSALRSTSPEQETVALFADDRLQTLAAALLRGVEPSELEQRWLEIGDSFPMAALAKGAAFCDTLSGSEAEKWTALRAALTRRNCQARYDALKNLLYRGEATPEELTEYARLATALKRS